MFARALDTDGTAWPPPGPVQADATMATLEVVHGHPAFVFYQASPPALMYVESTDANGTAWQTPVVLDNSGASGVNAPALFSLANGEPAVVFLHVSPAPSADLWLARLN
jgi:hypothetical protein